jgi:hypothetical protein
MTRKVVLAPITNKIKTPRQREKGVPCARTDFMEQCKRNEFILNGDAFWCWDDATKNKSIEGDIFIFWDYDGNGKGGRGNPWGGGKFIFHQIIGVKHPAHRLATWTNNVGQGHRNVLELSPPFLTLTYEEMIQHGTKLQYQGTFYPKTGFHEGSSIMTLMESRLNTQSRY